MTSALEYIGGIGYVKRRGWIQHGVPVEKCESVAGHMKRCAQAAMFYANERRLTEMLLFHDWPEVIAGDVTPRDNVSRGVKYARELSAAQEIARTLPGDRGTYFLGLWLEFEESKTERAILAKQLDKLDAGVKALEYEAQGFEVADFFPYTCEHLSDPTLLRIFELLLQREHPQLQSHLVYFSLLAQNPRHLNQEL